MAKLNLQIFCRPNFIVKRKNEKRKKTKHFSAFIEKWNNTQC
jgi:hypothetical protein